MSENWHWYLDREHSPAVNMAIDELLLEHAGELAGIPLLRTYGWDRPSISFGYVQNFARIPKNAGYTLVRRPTGGGVVWHDCDLTYTLVIPSEHSIYGLDRIESYHVFHRAVLRMLSGLGLDGRLADDAAPVADRGSVQCFVSPTIYDVMVGENKVAGAAQRRTRSGILHQGSILTSLVDGDRDRLIGEFRTSMEVEFNLTLSAWQMPDEWLAAAEELAALKYQRPSWNEERKWPGQ